jgi:hypothetical protein
MPGSGPGSGVSGIAVAATAAGALLVWSGLKGASVTQNLRLLLSGDKPSAATLLPVAGDVAETPGQTAGEAPGDPLPGDTGAASTSAAANQALARLSVALGHPSWAVGAQWQDWVSLWNRESGWNSLIMNPSSGAFGIAQALGHGGSGTSAVVPVVHYPGGSTAANVTVNEYPSAAANGGSALAQIQWGITYIAQTYGSPSAAWAHEVANGWY